MKIKLTIDLFSGRPNPSLVLSDADTRNLMKKVSFGSFRKMTEDSEPFPAMLGYRGIIIEEFGRRTKTDLPRIQFTPGYAYTHDGIAKSDALPAVESIVFDHLNSFEGIRGIKSFKGKLKKHMDDFHQKCPKWRKNHRKWYPGLLRDFYRPIKYKTCYCSPVPDVDAWNSDPNIQWNNNCYNYGTNYRTDTYAQPGYASGGEENDLSACSVPAGHISARMGAETDGLIALPSNNNTCPAVGHLVALVISPNWDYHWYRKGRNGKWSHKMGGSPATILDSSGNSITDPRTADRGSYVDFCTFMQAIHGHFKIDGPY
jgi:hypothetical protein